MKTIAGTAQGGVIRLPPGTHVRNGERVFMAIAERRSEQPLPPLPPELEEEELQFVRACRRRLNRYLRDEDS